MENGVKTPRGSLEKSLSRKTKKNLFYLSVVLLPLIQVFIFYFVVNFNSIMLAFQKQAVGKGFYFVGFENFGEVFSDLGLLAGSTAKQELAYLFKNSAILYLFTLVVGTGGAIVFSNYIYKKCLGHKFFRITLFLPNIVSGVVLVASYKFLIDNGIVTLVNKLTGRTILGLLQDPDTDFVFLMFFNLWFSFGTQVLMYTSSMSGISTEVVESASLDGVTPVKELIFITIPMIFNTIVSFITIGIAGFFTNQMMLYTFYGDSESKTHIWTFGYYIFKETKKASRHPGSNIFSYLSAMGLCMTIVAAPITIGVRKLLEKFGPSED